MEQRRRFSLRVAMRTVMVQLKLCYLTIRVYKKTFKNGKRM